MRSQRSLKYKNLTFVLISVLITLLLSRFETFHTVLLHLGGLGYLGAFLAGILFVSTFTVTAGALILLILAEKLSPLEIGIIAGLGGVVGDLIIFNFIKNNLMQEIKELYTKIDKDNQITKILSTKYFAWSLPLIGALIIASPLPDELGVSLLGMSKLKTYQFLIISFFLNVWGIMLVVSASAIIKP